MNHMGSNYIYICYAYTYKFVKQDICCIFIFCFHQHVCNPRWSRIAWNELFGLCFLEFRRCCRCMTKRRWRLWNCLLYLTAACSSWSGLRRLWCRCRSALYGPSWSCVLYCGVKNERSCLVVCHHSWVPIGVPLRSHQLWCYAVPAWNWKDPGTLWRSTQEWELCVDWRPSLLRCSLCSDGRLQPRWGWGQLPKRG